jgi:Ca2+-dependent lipid-binding protein
MNKMDIITFIMGILLIINGILFNLYHFWFSVFFVILGCVYIYAIFIDLIYNNIKRDDYKNEL